MTEERTHYNLARKSGPIGKSEPATHLIQGLTPVDDNKLIRRLVGSGNLSGFAWRSYMVLVYVLYGDDSAARERCAQVWHETLDAIPESDQLEIANRLQDLARETVRYSVKQSTGAKQSTGVKQ